MPSITKLMANGAARTDNGDHSRMIELPDQIISNPNRTISRYTIPLEKIQVCRQGKSPPRGFLDPNACLSKTLSITDRSSLFFSLAGAKE
jgi:hypothetical protein